MPGKREIGPLTGLRGIAATWVVLYHVHEFDPVTGPFGVMLRHGYMAVDCFFVLSGFVMALTYQDMFRDGATVSGYAVFLIRRIARIYPLYLLVTLGVVAITLAGWSRTWVVSASDLALNLLLVQAWGLGHTIDGPAWSISTEFAAYLLFPLLCEVALFSRPRVAAFMVGLSGAVVVAVAVLPFTHPASSLGPLDIFGYRNPATLFRCIAEFSVGLVAFRASGTMAVRNLFARLPISDAAALAILALLALPGADLAVALLFPILVVGLFYESGLTAKFMGCRPVFFLGEISYAIYLLHAQFVRVRTTGTALLTPHLGAHAAELVSLAALYGSLFLCATLCYSWVEKPARRALRGTERFVKALA